MKNTIRKNRRIHINSGERYGMLVILKEVDIKVGKKRVFKCLCDCGNACRVGISSLRHNKQKSCGCLIGITTAKRNMTHGKSKLSIYKRWQGMKKRCDNKNDKFYHAYGGRGIRYTKRWSRFENFYVDMSESYTSGLTLERIDVNKGYSKNNCTWIPMSEQAKNRRMVVTYKGINADEGSRKLGGCHGLISRRLKMGWDKETAFTKPVRKIKNKNTK